MAKIIGQYKIPFDDEGNQLHYPDFKWVNGKRVDCDMIDNFEFRDTLSFDGMSRGRSAAYFHFRRSSGEKVIVFMKDLCEMMPNITYGHITGRFTFIKRGQNYGAVYLGV